MNRFQHVNRSKKIRKDSRTIPVPGHRDYGGGEDDGKWYRCWHCGFLCNVERDELGGPNDENQVSAIAYTQTDEDGNTAYHCEGVAGKDQTTCEAAGGTWSSTRYEPVVGAGCPLCGTLNWKGDF